MIFTAWWPPAHVAMLPKNCIRMELYKLNEARWCQDAGEHKGTNLETAIRSGTSAELDSIQLDRQGETFSLSTLEEPDLDLGSTGGVTWHSSGELGEFV
jgi:hypothetical protein